MLKLKLVLIPLPPGPSVNSWLAKENRIDRSIFTLSPRPLPPSPPSTPHHQQSRTIKKRVKINAEKGIKMIKRLVNRKIQGRWCGGIVAAASITVIMGEG